MFFCFVFLNELKNTLGLILLLLRLGDVYVGVG